VLLSIAVNVVTSALRTLLYDVASSSYLQILLSSTKKTHNNKCWITQKSLFSSCKQQILLQPLILNKHNLQQPTTTTITINTIRLKSKKSKNNIHTPIIIGTRVLESSLLLLVDCGSNDTSIVFQVNGAGSVIVVCSNLHTINIKQCEMKHDLVVMRNKHILCYLVRMDQDQET
jgi:hypothetical protein